MRIRKLCFLLGLLFVFSLAFAIISPLAHAQTSEWTWMGGSNVIPSGSSEPGPPGVYGTMGVASATNMPGGRFYAASWTDKQGNLWLFGGGGKMRLRTTAT